MEYQEHLLLIFIPQALLVILCILIFFIIVCYESEKAKNKIMSLFFGGDLLEDKEDKLDKYCAFEKIHVKHGTILFAVAMSFITMILMIMWIILVEHISVEDCQPRADCFVAPHPPNQLHNSHPDRVTNCTEFELTNNVTLTCFRAGFYPLEAMGIGGGVHTVIATTTTLIFPVLLALFDQHLGYQICMGVTLSIFGFVLVAVYIGLVVALPPHYLSFVLEPANAAVVLSSIMTMVLMSMATGCYPSDTL